MQATETQELLTDSIARNAPIVLSIPSAGLIRHFKSRFLGNDAGGLWIELPSDANAIIQEITNHRAPLAISFNPRGRRMTFVTDLIKVNETYLLNAASIVPAIHLTHPAEVRAVQRRSNYRVAVTSDSELSARIWLLGEQDHLEPAPIAARELKVDISDISSGGIGVRLLPTNPTDRKLVLDLRLRIEIKHRSANPFLLEGRLRTLGKGSNSQELGIAFKKLEDDLNGRQTLATISKIVADLQRDEVRRIRRTAA